MAESRNNISHVISSSDDDEDSAESVGGPARFISTSFIKREPKTSAPAAVKILPGKIQTKKTSSASGISTAASQKNLKNNNISSSLTPTSTSTRSANTKPSTTGTGSTCISNPSSTPQKEKDVAKIVTFNYKDYLEDQDGKTTAVCITCNTVISDRKTTTSNYRRHVKNSHGQR